MDNITRIKALKKTRVKVDKLVKEIDELTQANIQQLNENVDEICSRIEKDLEEIYKLTDENVYRTRHLSVCLYNTPKEIKNTYGIAFDGETNEMYFMDTERSYGTKGNDKKYHIVIADYSDASGRHYYEDGKWREEIILGMTWKEYFATYWEDIKEQIITEIAKAYESYNKDQLHDAMSRLDDSENRLSKTENKN